MIVTVPLLSHPLQAAVIIPENALSEDGWVSANTAIELRLDESTEESVEDSTKTTAKPRILLGKQDISIFFKKIGEGHYRYQAAIFPLPSGENKLSVYQLTDDPNQPWELITSESLKVLTKSGFQAIENTPLLNANVNTLLAKKSQQARATPDSLQLTMGLENRLQTEKWQLQSNVNLESLVQKQGNQDDLDDVLLNDYLLEWQRDATQVSIGHISDGEHPLLFDAFATRGIKLQYRFNPRFDFVVSSQNGSAITGFSNPVGLAARQHNISALTLGMEFFPAIAGRLRSEFTWMDAKLQAEDDFNELSIPDTQSNRAFGLRLMGRNDKGTVAARVNFARSKQEGLGDGFIDEDAAFDAEFDDEFDDEVDDGFNDDIIALDSQWHNAISAEVSWNVLAPDKKWADRPVSLLANYSFHRIDPEYATVGASINANELRHGIDLTMRVGDISNQLSASTVQDNLDHITSFLVSYLFGLWFDVQQYTIQFHEMGLLMVILGLMISYVQRLIQLQFRFQALSLKLFDISEKERQHVARELHDGISQRLAALRLHLQLLSKQHPTIGLEKNSDELLAVMEEMGRVLHGLHPLDLDEYGLILAMQHEIDRVAESSDIPIIFDADEVNIVEEKEQHLFRIFQECLSNAVRHAQAGVIHVSLKTKGRQLSLSIEDDGKGWQQKPISGRKWNGLGKLTLQERIEMINARLSINIKENQGTQVRIDVKTV